MTKLLLSLALAASLGAQTLSLRSRDWSTIGIKVRSSDLTFLGWTKPKLGNARDGSLIYDFPNYANSSTFQTLGYLYTPFTTPIQAYDPVSMTGNKLIIMLAVAKTGNPQFQWKTQADNNCDIAVQYCQPAALRPYLESGFTGTCASGLTSDWCNRWWSADIMFDLQQNSWVLRTGTDANGRPIYTPIPNPATIPLDPARWTTVNGTTGLVESDAWAWQMSHPINVGGTCGGGYFYGHGCFATGGTAQFQLMGYSVQ